MNPQTGDAGSSSGNDQSFVGHVSEEYNSRTSGDDSRIDSSFQTTLAESNTASSLYAHHNSTSNHINNTSLYPALSTTRDWTQDSRWFSQADGPNQPQYTTSASAGYAPSSLWPSQANSYHDSARSRSSFGDAFHTSTLARPTDVFTPSAFVSLQSHPYHLPQAHPSGITMSTMHSSVLPQSSDTSFDYFAQSSGPLTSQPSTRDSRTPRTLPAPPSSSPSAQRSRKQSVIKRRSRSRSVTSSRRSRANTPQLQEATMPPSGAFSYKPTKHLADMYCNGRRVLPVLTVRQHKSFDIAPDESKYVGYRRNYFCLDTAYHLELQPTAEKPHERELARGNIMVNDHIVKAFAISISGIDNSHSGKVVELVQFSPKRDHGKKGRPPLHRIAPTLNEFVSPLGNGPAAHSLRSSYAEGPILPYQDARDPCQLDKSLYGHGEEVPDGMVTNHTWERIQFKNATANNGRRRQNQQAFMVVVTLWADIRETRENGRAPYWLPVAKCHSDEVVIRGRSPNHYHPKSGGASTVASASISRMQLEAPTPQAMGLGSSMRSSAGHNPHTHFPALTNSHHATNTIGNFRGQAFNNESTFGQLRTHWSDNSAYPSANTHHYGGAQPFDSSRGADQDWESGSELSMPMELDPLLEEAKTVETIESPSLFEGSQRRSSSLSCSAFSSGIAETPFTVFSPHDLTTLAESPCTLTTSPQSHAWSSIEGMHSIDLAAAAAAVDHDESSFSPAGHHWGADWEDEFDDASILLVSPTLAATAAAEHLSTPAYPRLDGAASPQSGY